MGRWPTLRQKELIFSELGYSPHAEQMAVHRSAAEVVQIVGAEAGGKSFVTAAEITALVPWCKLVYLVGETYVNAKPEFDYISRNLQDLALLDPARVHQDDNGKSTLLTVTGCRIDTLSARKGASAIIAKGESPDVIVLCEAGVIQSFSVATAAVRRVTRAKGRCILVGTLQNNFSWYAGLYDELQAEGNAWRGETYSLPAWSNLHLYPGGRGDPEIKRLEILLSEDEFARTVAARKVPSKALVFPEFKWSVHARPCPFDPGLPVHLGIDPGYFPSVYAVLPFQFHGDEVWQIDELALNFHTHKQVIAEAKKREWWQNTLKGTHVIDVAGKQHHAEESAVEIWSSEAGLYLHTNKVGIMTGIGRHRDFLQGERPRLFHDAERCRYTLEEYGKYKRPTDRDGNPTADEPKDEHNHSMKAIAYFLVHHFGLSDRKREAKAGTVKRPGLREGLKRGGYR